MTEITLHIDGRHFLFIVIGIIMMFKMVFHWIDLINEVIVLRKKLGKD